jgi:YSIRK-targeted surface antigen transcriptional regulator
MDTEYLLKTCELLYASYNLPIICFNDRKEVIEFNCSYLGYEKVFRHIADKVTDKSNPSLVSGYAGLYGAIQTTDGKILILVGPFKNKKITDGLLASVIHEHGLDWNELDSLKEFIDSIPRISYSKFLNFICLVHYLFNREEISIVDFFNLHINDFKVPEKYTEEIWKQDDFIHGTYNLEQRILSYVRNGDVEGLVAFFRTVANVPTPEGKLADDTLRQSKNIFIGFIALVGKVGAIKGNLDIEQTYQLIDLYTQECERCISVNQVNELRYNAIIDFAQRVADQKHPEAYSNEVYSALQFIKTHTNQPIGVNDVLKHVYKSRSVFMEQFKKETGETIGRYILKAKLQESKQLLAYSDKSIADISNFLYFSSQPHFQRAFKNEYGITPLAYRKKKQK